METVKSVVFIYQLPYKEREELCLILDVQGKWKELGGRYMQFDVLTMESIGREFQRGGSPSDTLLTKWGCLNHTILELFFILSKMHHYQAMKILKPLVNEKYHRMIYEGEESMSRILRIPVGAPSAPPISNDNYILNENNQSNLENINFEAKSVLDNVRKEVLPTKQENKTLNEMDNFCRVQTIDYEELVAATDNWDSSKILGQGGFGTVFKGKWKNIDVAIKRIKKRVKKSNEHSCQSEKTQSQRELSALSSFRHDNILSLYGYSEGVDYCLVYQYMPNGSLEDCLHKNKFQSLSWFVRLAIAKGVANGLHFLHSSKKPIVHGDIKCANILLDKNYEPRIGDFGLARYGPLKQVTSIQVSQIHGTKAYLPKDYLASRKMNPKVDTYSFGIVMLELATSLKALDRDRKIPYLNMYIASLDEQTAANELRDRKAWPIEDAVAIPFCQQFLAIGLFCAAEKRDDRPDMQKVIERLESVIVPIQTQPNFQDRRSSCPPTLQILSPFNPWGKQTPETAYGLLAPNMARVNLPLAVNTNFPQYPSTVTPQPITHSPQLHSPYLQPPRFVPSRPSMSPTGPPISPPIFVGKQEDIKETSEEEEQENVFPLISLLGISEPNLQDTSKKSENKNKNSSDENANDSSEEKNNENDFNEEHVSTATSNSNEVESTAQMKTSKIF